MTPKVLGIDISKKDFYVSLLTESRATKPKKFTNNTQGFESLHNWLKQQNVVELHACMELQALLRRLESVTEMMTSEQNRLETATPTVAALTLEHLEYLREQQQLIKKLISDHFDQHPHLKQQRELLTSIPGIGDLTASVLLAEIGEVSDYENARQLAAYAGLTPSERSSGTSVKGKTRLSCTGNVRLPKALYMPAVVAMPRNPLLKAMSERLLGRGVKMQVIDALMRKLVPLAFGILKSQK